MPPNSSRQSKEWNKNNTSGAQEAPFGWVVDEVLLMTRNYSGAEVVTVHGLLFMQLLHFCCSKEALLGNILLYQRQDNGLGQQQWRQYPTFIQHIPDAKEPHFWLRAIRAICATRPKFASIATTRVCTLFLHGIYSCEIFTTLFLWTQQYTWDFASEGFFRGFSSVHRLGMGFTTECAGNIYIYSVTSVS